MKNFDEILDISVRHRIFLQRLSANHEQELAKLLSAGGRDKSAIVREGLDVALAEGKFTRKQTALLANMEKELGKAIGSTVDSAKDWYIRELDHLVQNEIEGAEKILSASVPVSKKELIKHPALASVKRLTETTPYSGYTIEQWFSGTSETAMRRIMARVRVGIANGESIDQMVMAIRGTPAAKYADGILSGYTERQARTIARTLTNGVSNAAYQDVFAENKELIAYERYTATLDGRTSLVCASLDGNTYKVGEGPVPPLHPNCRSLRIAITEGMAEDAKRGESGLANRQSYQEWLKRQPEWMQKEVLGETRQKLFAEGKMTLDKFVDMNGQSYTLDQLKQIDKAAFKKAGIIEKEQNTIILKEAINPQITKEEKAFVEASKPKRIPVKIENTKTVEIPNISTEKQKIATKGVKPAKLNSQEVGEIEYYKGDGFYKNNKILLDQKAHTKEEIEVAKKSTKRIDSIIQKNKTTEDMQLYRGLRSKDLYESAESLVGKTINNVIPQSTSYDEGVARAYAGMIGKYSAEKNGSVLLKINTKSGSSALNIENYTKINSSEKEILLRPSSKYIVKSVKQDGDLKIITVDYEE